MKKTLIITIAVFIGLQLCGQDNYFKISDKPVKSPTGQLLTKAEYFELTQKAKYTFRMTLDSEGNEFFQMVRLPIGDPAPEFKMVDTNGNELSTESSKDKIVVLNFWFTTCKPCIEEIPELNQVYSRYRENEHVVFASITFNKENEVKKFLEENPLQYPIVANARNICNLFKVNGYPTNIVIGKDSKILDYHSGGFAGIGEKIAHAIEEAL